MTTEDGSQHLLGSSETVSPVPAAAEDSLRSDQPVGFADVSCYSSRNYLSTTLPLLNCRICQEILQLGGKLHLHVIKCHVCGEATPIRPPPPMKKYVRCECNCLLICKISSKRIICSRDNCKRVINLPPLIDLLDIVTDEQSECESVINFRVFCANCGFSFRTSSPKNTLQFCSHCGKKTFSNVRSRKRKLYCLSLFFVILMFISAVLSLLTFMHWFDIPAISDVTLGLFLFFTVSCGIVLFYHCSLSVSRVEREPTGPTSYRSINE